MGDGVAKMETPAFMPGRTSMPVFDTVGSLVPGISIGSFMRFGHSTHRWLLVLVIPQA
jgi:hypothetical protein